MPASPSLRTTGYLEAEPCAELNFASRGRNLGDAAKAGCVHKPVWSAEVGVIERVEELCACLEVCFLSHREVASDSQIHADQRGTVHGIAAHVAIGIGRREQQTLLG